MSETTNEASVSIVIVNWNGYEVTKDCLDSLLNIDYGNFKVILVDNGSRDQSVLKLQSDFSDQHFDFLALDKNYGFTGGNNEGLEYAKKKYNSDYYLLLNNDTIVTKNFLTEMLVPFKDKRSCYAVVPKIFYLHPDNVLWFAGGHISKLTGIVKHFGINQVDTGKFEQPSSLNYMTGCCALISSEAIDKIGLLDDIFFANSEDVDYSLRIVKSGHTIEYAPAAIIYHKVNFSFNSNRGKWFSFYLMARNKILLQRKHSNAFIFPAFLLVFGFRWVVYLTIKLFLLRDFKSVKAIYWGLSDGFKNRLRFTNQ